MKLFESGHNTSKESVNCTVSRQLHPLRQGLFLSLTVALPPREIKDEEDDESQDWVHMVNRGCLGQKCNIQFFSGHGNGSKESSYLVKEWTFQMT